MSTKYMFLIYSDEAAMADATPEQWDQMLQAHNAWAASVHAAGATIHGGDALAPSATATTVRTGGASPVVTDGPFAETKELVGGFWVLQTKSRAEVLEWVKKVPFENGEEIEIRQISEAEDFEPIIKTKEGAETLAKEAAFRAQAKR